MRDLRLAPLAPKRRGAWEGRDAAAEFQFGEIRGSQTRREILIVQQLVASVTDPAPTIPKHPSSSPPESISTSPLLLPNIFHEEVRGIAKETRHDSFSPRKNDEFLTDSAWNVGRRKQLATAKFVDRYRRTPIL